MRSAKPRIAGSLDFASAILPTSTSVMPACAAWLTNVGKLGTEVSASAASTADDALARARNRMLVEGFMALIPFGRDHEPSRMRRSGAVGYLLPDRQAKPQVGARIFLFVQVWQRRSLR